MNCPECNHRINRVMNTRQESEETTVRQRLCMSCAHVFHTVEVHLPPESVQWKNKLMQRVDGFRGIRFF